MLEDDLARLEREVLGVRKVSTFLEAVEAIRRLLETHPAEVRARILALTAPTLGRELAAAVSAGFNLGTISGNALTGGAPPTDPEPPRPLVAASVKLEAEVRDLVARARKLARAGVEPELAASSLFGAVNKVKRGVTTLVNESGNRGVLEAARSADMLLVWVAETNACVHCLAYSGRTLVAGEDWPEGLTYGASSPHAPGKTPPLHPNCRCTLEPLVDPSYAEALRREADRSVLRGFSLESESMRVRVDAAKRLLDNGVDAPKSVIAYAERSVKVGKFGTRDRPKATPAPRRPKPKTRPSAPAKAKAKSSTPPPRAKSPAPASAQPTPKAQQSVARELKSPPPSRVVDAPTTRVQNKTVPNKTADPRGKDFRSMTNDERVEAARRMYGDGSPQVAQAIKKWGGTQAKPARAPKPQPQAPRQPKTNRPDPRGKDYRDMSNAERLEAVRIMYGDGSLEYRKAKKRWG